MNFTLGDKYHHNNKIESLINLCTVFSMIDSSLVMEGQTLSIIIDSNAGYIYYQLLLNVLLLNMLHTPQDSL